LKHVWNTYKYLSTRLCWYVGEKYLRDLKAKEEFSPRVLDSIQALSEYLVSEVRVMERGTENAKREAREHVPTERVKDPAAVARELRWRVRIAAGHGSDDEGTGAQVATTNGLGVNGNKRKRLDSENGEDKPNFKNFKPRVWESVKENVTESETRELKGRRPENGEEWKEHWIEWKDEVEDEGEPVDVNSRQHVVVKVRRTVNGVERQRVERVVEEWTWKSKEVEG
jgi:hypothetical protein